MKKIELLLILMFLGTLSVNAQRPAASQKTSAAYSSKQLSTLADDDIRWNNFIADNMCVISDMPAEKTASLATIDLGSQSQSTSETFNPLLLNIRPLENSHQYFKIAGTSNVLFVYSKERLDVMYQRTLKNNKK